VNGSEMPLAGSLPLGLVESARYSQTYFDAHQDEIAVGDFDVAAFICVTAVDALAHAAVLRRPEILIDEKAKRFVDEVTNLVIRYLRRS
jgi:hypothetical protein